MQQRLSSGDLAEQITGQAAHDAVAVGNPVRVAGKAVTADPAAVATGDQADVKVSTVGAVAVTLNQVPELTWQYAAQAGGILNATAIAAKAAAAAGIRNYVTGLQLQNAGAVATEFVVLDGAAVMWRGNLPAAMVDCFEVNFRTPLRGTAATALNIQCLTTGAAVYANLQGFIAP